MVKQPPRFKILVINLARSPERWQHIAQQLSALNLVFERVDAVDGRNLSDADIAQVFDAQKARTHYHYDLTKGEIACYLSHQKAWQQVLNDGLDFAVVLEDDVFINAQLEPMIEQLTTLPVPWSLMKLAAPFKAQPYRELADFHSMQLVQYTKKPPMGAAGYAISKAGAHQLLTQCKQIFRPVDVDMQWMFELGIRCLGMLPYPIDNTHQHGSDILSVEPRSHVKRRPWVRIKHQLGLFVDNLRARYRDRHLARQVSDIFRR